jgi:hypothetical protein
MAEYGEWNRKGAVLSDVTAQKEYGVTRDFILKGVQAGELEFREGAVWGNPYLRVLRSQLERYIYNFNMSTNGIPQTDCLCASAQLSLVDGSDQARGGDGSGASLDAGSSVTRARSEAK